MKIFKTETKVNFVDENNVVLGYDTDQHCCESAGWFIANKPVKGLILSNAVDCDNLDGWLFDPLYCERVNNPGDFYEGGMVIFRIVNKELSQYIHLYNCHNGYYSHSFSMNVGGNTIEGCI